MYFTSRELETYARKQVNIGIYLYKPECQSSEILKKLHEQISLMHQEARKKKLPEMSFCKDLIEQLKKTKDVKDKIVLFCIKSGLLELSQNTLNTIGLVEDTLDENWKD